MLRLRQQLPMWICFSTAVSQSQKSQKSQNIATNRNKREKHEGEHTETPGQHIETPKNYSKRILLAAGAKPQHK